MALEPRPGKHPTGGWGKEHRAAFLWLRTPQRATWSLTRWRRGPERASWGTPAIGPGSTRGKAGEPSLSSASEPAPMAQIVSKQVCSGQPKGSDVGVPERGGQLARRLGNFHQEGSPRCADWIPGCALGSGWTHLSRATGGHPPTHSPWRCTLPSCSELDLEPKQAWNRQKQDCRSCSPGASRAPGGAVGIREERPVFSARWDVHPGLGSLVNGAGGEVGRGCSLTPWLLKEKGPVRTS